MRVKVQKWGNSLAVRIPKAAAAAAKVDENTLVEISVVEKSLVIKPSKDKRVRLRDLVKGIKKENMHSEFDWGRPMGKEIVVKRQYVPDRGDIVWLNFIPQAGHAARRTTHQRCRSV